MRWMNFDHPDLEPQKLLDIGHDIGCVPRMQTATRDQPLGIGLYVIRDELVDFGCESDDLGGDVIDQRSTIETHTIHVFQEGFRGTAILFNLGKVRPLRPHQLERGGLEHFDGRNMDVTVSDHAGGRSSAEKPLTAKGAKIPQRSPRKPDYFPFHFESRFSRKARIPSRASSIFINSSR